MESRQIYRNVGDCHNTVGHEKRFSFPLLPTGVRTLHVSFVDYITALKAVSPFILANIRSEIVRPYSKNSLFCI